MVSSSIHERKSSQNLDDGCTSTSTIIRKKAAKDRIRCSLRKGKLRKRHSTRTIKAEKPIIPPKPRLLSSARPIVPADSQASPSKPIKPAIPPKPFLSKSKAEKPIIAPKPQKQAWDSGRPIIQSKPQVPSHAPEANIRPMPPVTQMCPIAVLTPMGFLIPRNFPSAILMNQVTFTEDEQIHPDDPVQVGPSIPVAQTHDSHKCTNVSSISNEVQEQLTDLFASMCQVQDSSNVADHIKTENFNFPNVSKHTKNSAVMQNPRLALALRNILLDVQVIQIEAPAMMEMLGKKTGVHKEYKRGVHAISATLGTASKAGEPNKFPDPDTDFRMDLHRKHFAQNTDIFYKSESPTACKFGVISSVAETAQETEHEVAETAEASDEIVSVEKKSKKTKCTETEARCIPKSSFSGKSSSEELQANRKDMGSSVAEKIISFSQLIEEKTHGAVEANMKTNNSKATCSNVNRKESNKSNVSNRRPPKNVKFGEKEEEGRHFDAFPSNNLNITNADPSSLHDGTTEIPRSLNPESENRVKRSDRIPKLAGKEDCSELKDAYGNGNPTEANSRESLSKSDEIQEKSRAVVEDLKRRLANTQGSTTTVTQDDVVDIWDSFSSSSSLDDEHIYEEIDEMTEVFGTEADEDRSLHNKFSAMSKEYAHHIEEEVLVKASEVKTASIHSLAQASSHEKEAVMSGEAAKSNRKLQEERRDAKCSKLKSAKKSNNAGVTIKNKEKQSTSTSQQSDTSVDISSEDEESKNFCFVIGF